MNKSSPPPADCMCELIQRGEQLSQDQATLRAAIREEEAKLQRGKKKVRRLQQELDQPSRK